MQFEIQAGAKLDLFTREEFREDLTGAITAWRAEANRGFRFPKFSAQGTVSGGGTWTIGGEAADNQKDTLGPNPGFIWCVTRIAVSGNGFVKGTDTFDVYIDEITPTKIVSSGHTRWQPYDVGILVLNGGERLALSGVGTGVNGTDVTLSGQAIELPVQMAWQLL